MVNANYTDGRRLKLYGDSGTTEEAPNTNRLEALYKEAGVALPGAVMRTLSEAREFNEKIVANRREFISEEIGTLEKNVSVREREVAELTDQRAEYLDVLAASGALEEFTSLQELHAATRLKVDELTNRIIQVWQMITKTDTMKVETIDLKRAKTLDYKERRALWSKALGLFLEYSESLIIALVG